MMSIALNEPSILEIFRTSLNIGKPWLLVGYEFDDREQQWILFVDFERGVEFECLICKQACRAVDAHHRTWRYLDLLQWKTTIHAALPRFYCSHCRMNRFHMTPAWSKFGSPLD